MAVKHLVVTQQIKFGGKLLYEERKKIEKKVDKEENDNLNFWKR